MWAHLLAECMTGYGPSAGLLKRVTEERGILKKRRGTSPVRPIELRLYKGAWRQLADPLATLSITLQGFLCMVTPSPFRARR